MKFAIAKIVRPDSWADGLPDRAQDWERFGFECEMPHLELRSVDPVPVLELPSANNEQFGHAVAYGVSKCSLKRARKLLRREPQVGDILEIEARPTSIRNVRQRREGVFPVVLADPRNPRRRGRD